MKKTRLLRTAAILLLAAALPFYFAAAEGMIPPSPEPPNENTAARPTAAPTEAPTEELTDHVHHPEVMPRFHFQKGKKLLEIWFPNIKDADEAILLYDGQVWMIDCGDYRMGDRGVLLIKQLGIEKIDVLFNSHPHHDHIDGLAKTDEAAKVGEVRICFAPELTESGLRMLNRTKERGIPVTEYRDGDVFAMGDGAVELRILKNNESNLDMNNQSAVTKITYGERSILFTADMEAPGQQAMIARVGADILKSDILKYPHHAKSDMDTAFFEAVGAKLAIVTSAEGRGDAGQIALNTRGLPAIYTFSNDKFTHLVTDGEYWLAEQVPITVK